MSELHSPLTEDQLLQQACDYVTFAKATRPEDTAMRQNFKRNALWLARAETAQMLLDKLGKEHGFKRYLGLDNFYNVDSYIYQPDTETRCNAIAMLDSVRCDLATDLVLSKPGHALYSGTEQRRAQRDYAAGFLFKALMSPDEDVASSFNDRVVTSWMKDVLADDLSGMFPRPGIVPTLQDARQCTGNLVLIASCIAENPNIYELYVSNLVYRREDPDSIEAAMPNPHLDTDIAFLQDNRDALWLNEMIEFHHRHETEQEAREKARAFVENMQRKQDEKKKDIPTVLRPFSPGSGPSYN